MKTFIEQKNELQREIDGLERENERLFDIIDKNELTMAQLKDTLTKVGSESETKK